MGPALAARFWDDPFFWAFLALLGWLFGFLVVGSQTVAKNPVLGIGVVALAEIPRLMLSLPIIAQPRFGDSALVPILGSLILCIALLFALPVVRIHPFTKPQQEEPLRTTGLYAVVRHPLYVCDTLWPLGVAVLCRSVIGTVLVVVWFLVAAQLAWFEEEQLLKAYGAAYQAYMGKVKWRLIPYVF